MKILVVEDNPDSLLLLSWLLNERGHNEVSAVSCGTAAIEELEAKKFDIVICDYQMPDITGHEVRKTELEKIFGTVESVRQELSMSL